MKTQIAKLTNELVDKLLELARTEMAQKPVGRKIRKTTAAPAGRKARSQKR